MAPRWMPDRQASDTPDVDDVDALLRETRALRISVRDLIGRMRRDRRDQQRHVDAILRSQRLTSPQRQRLRDGLQRRPPR